MRIVSVAAATLNQTPLDWPGNLARITAAIGAARERGARVLCLPELCISGYGCEDAFHGRSVAEQSWRVLGELAVHTRGMLVVAGLPLRFRAALYNAIAIVADGEIAGFFAKQHLARDGVHYEQRWFEPWPRGELELLERDGRAFPIGDLYVDAGGLRVGFEICEDAWVPDRVGGGGVAVGLDLLLNASASHFAPGKHAVRERIVLEGSRAYAVSYLYANLEGNEAGRVIYDGGAMVAQAGRVLARTARFGYHDFQLALAAVDVDVTRDLQTRLPGFGAQSAACAPRRVALEFSPWGGERPTPELVASDHDVGPDRDLQELTRALALGLFDYLRKSGASGFVLSLSGGADSAAVACAVHAMVVLARAALGDDGVAERLHAPRHDSTAAWTSHLLVCVYQATEHSSARTREAARGLARALGAQFHVLDIQRIVAAYGELVGDVLGRPLDWQRDDLALQNVQARARAPSVWMLANVRNALLLCTSNRSEAAVGYATMDGDTSGSLCPIAAVSKSFVHRWLRWRQSTALGELPAIAELDAIVSQAPTAELRPAACLQSDEQDLMPYAVLDAIEHLAVRDKRPPVDCLQLLAGEFPQHDRAQLRAWLTRFLSLWSRNQWKRERFAPAFHLDDSNLDPKTWCRFPILSGAYRRELDELAAAAEP